MQAILPSIYSHTKKKKKNPWHDQLSTSIQQCTCALETGGLLFKQTKSPASPVTAQRECSQMQGVLCYIFRAVLLCYYMTDRQSNSKAIIQCDVYFGFSASLSRQHCKISVKVINLHCANHSPRCGMLICMWLNALVSDSRELCRSCC